MSPSTPNRLFSNEVSGLEVDHRHVDRTVEVRSRLPYTLLIAVNEQLCSGRRQPGWCAHLAASATADRGPYRCAAHHNSGAGRAAAPHTTAAHDRACAGSPHPPPLTRRQRGGHRWDHQPARRVAVSQARRSRAGSGPTSPVCLTRLRDERSGAPELQGPSCTQLSSRHSSTTNPQPGVSWTDSCRGFQTCPASSLATG